MLDFVRRLYSPWNSPGQSARVGIYSLLQEIVPTQGSNPGLLHCRRILYQLSRKGSPRILEWAAFPFSRGSSWPRNQTRDSWTTGRFFTNWAIREAHEISTIWIQSKYSSICVVQLVQWVQCLVQVLAKIRMWFHKPDFLSPQSVFCRLVARLPWANCRTSLCLGLLCVNKERGITFIISIFEKLNNTHKNA